LSDPAYSDPADLAAMRRHLATLIDSRALELPPMPGVAAEVMATSLDDHADTVRLAKLIQTDQGLAGHVLRVVNSPAMRAATEIVALQQAIARLGMNKIREIAIAASLSSSLFKQSGYQAESARAWKRALCAGLWAKEVARACRKNTEMAYLCGLLHNIGTPVLLHALGRVTAAPLPERDVMLLLAEFGAVAGELLAREWRLPEPVIATVRWLDDFASSTQQTDNVAVANCAAGIAHLMLDGCLSVDAVAALESIRHLNLYRDDVETLLELRDAIRASMESMAA
jgi:HD-like signal output (HDOD) protein